MAYLEKTADVRASPENLLPGARSVVCLAAPYRSAPLRGEDGSSIARYAAGADYHGSLRKSAIRVAKSVGRRLEEPFGWRVCVDSTPLAERVLRRGRGPRLDREERLLDRREHGSWLLLAEIVTDLDLPADEPGRGVVRLVRALPRALPDRSLPGSRRARRRTLSRVLDDRAPRPIPDAWKRGSGSTSSAATSARRPVRGTAPLSALADGADAAAPAHARRDPRDGQGRVEAPLRHERRQSRRRGVASSAMPPPRPAPAATRRAGRRSRRRRRRGSAAPPTPRAGRSARLGAASG